MTALQIYGPLTQNKKEYNEKEKKVVRSKAQNKSEIHPGYVDSLGYTQNNLPKSIPKALNNDA